MKSQNRRRLVIRNDFFPFPDRQIKEASKRAEQKKMGSSEERVSEKGEGVCFFWTPLLRQWSPSEILVQKV